ncbi:hypothetical protein LJY25_09215 [Hymenobacter sp. BT175]|uniref:hypothetical protein n=1 Tax=Hymenobacter translucens TaxID=2886507 RepID=UPI001D0E697C|nr:hypothetical protein [Hymenobacter translucens]MCC2546621.1 hypothetical protein [Hymenobacter translucens]
MAEQLYAKILGKTIAEDIGWVLGSVRKYPLDIGLERSPGGPSISGHDDGTRKRGYRTGGKLQRRNRLLLAVDLVLLLLLAGVSRCTMEWQNKSSAAPGLFSQAFFTLLSIPSNLYSTSTMSDSDNMTTRFTKGNVHERQYELELPSGVVQVGVQCKNIPTDGFIEASMPGRNGELVFNVPKMSVHHPNLLVIYSITFAEPCRATMTIRYYVGSQSPGYMASVDPVVFFPSENRR